MAKLIEDNLVQTLQMIIVKGAHPAMTWESVNNALYQLNQLPTVEDPKPHDAPKDWKDAAAVDTSIISGKGQDDQG